MTKPHDDKNGEGLALPLEAINVSGKDGWDFGWCVVNANKRVHGYCLTEKQAHQIVDAVNGTIPSATPQKPVAWRYKNEPTADWRHLGFPPAGVGSDAVVEPLYAAPCSEPVAWAVVTSDGDPREANSIHWPATCRHVHDGDAKAAAQAWADRFGYSIVPLYATDGGKQT